MKHNDLIDAIDRQIIIAPPFALGGYTVWLRALREVVELHKSDEYCCPVCGPALDICGVVYPCSTIRAIYEVLK